MTMHDSNAAPPVAQALAAQNIPHRVFQHAGPVTSLEQAAAERGQRPEQIIRSLLFRLADDNYVMVLMAGPDPVAWRSLRRYLGQSRVTTATREEVLAVTGYPIGAVAPIGLPRPLRILVDRTVLEQEEVSLGSGIRGAAVLLRTADLQRALGEFETGDFRSTPAADTNPPGASSSGASSSE